MALDGSGPVRLTKTPGGHSRRAECSPDGARIAFGSDRDGNEELYVMRLDGSEVRNVSRHPAREYYSRWSPDGLWLLFTSNRDRARNAIYVMGPDGNDVRRVFP
jgi:Tol biopolymer transport system component